MSWMLDEFSKDVDHKAEHIGQWCICIYFIVMIIIIVVSLIIKNGGWYP